MKFTYLLIAVALLISCSDQQKEVIQKSSCVNHIGWPLQESNDIHQNKAFYDWVLGNIKSGKWPAYTLNDSTKEWDQKVEINKIDKILSGTVDSNMIINPITNEIRYEVVSRDFVISNAKKLKLDQEWFYNDQKNVLESKIKALYFVLTKYSESNMNFIGERAVLKVYFN